MTSERPLAPLVRRNGCRNSAALWQRLIAIQDELELLPSDSWDSPVCLAWTLPLADALAGFFSALEGEDAAIRDQLLACPALDVCSTIQAELRLGAVGADAVRVRLSPALSQLRSILSSSAAVTPAR